MDTVSVAKTEESKGGPREVWHPLVTPEKRAERVRLAKAFLATFGRDDDVDTHYSSLGRLR